MLKLKNKNNFQNRVSVGGVNVCTKGCYAFADTGHTLLSGVRSEIKQINKKLGFASDGSIDCNKRATMPSK